jgi:hypothetical protein
MLAGDFASLQPGKAAWDRIRAACERENVSLPELSADEEHQLVDFLGKLPKFRPIE